MSSSATVTQGFVTNDNVRIHYRTAGQGPLMILVHGFPDNGETWNHQIAALSTRYTVVCPTLRGFPPSDVPNDDKDYDLAKIVGDLIAIFMHFKSKTAIFVGHDFGGAAVQMLALNAPDLVSGLILLNAPIIPTLRQLVNFDEEQQTLSEYTIHYMKYKPGDDKEVVKKTTGVRDPARRQQVQQYLEESPMHGMMAYYKMNYPAPPYGQVVDTSGMQYHVPTLIIWGVEDEYFSPKTLDGLPQIFCGPTRLVMLPKAGHWSFQDEPEKVNREILSWLVELGTV